MITITRQSLGIKMKNIYFPEESDFPIGDQSADLIGITQSLTPLDKLHLLETLQINLLQSEDELLADMTKSTRQQIRQATKKYNFNFQVLPSPTNRDIQAFRHFYNKFAKNKNTYKCNLFHVRTLRLLKEKNNLLITRIINEEKEVLCYRVYIVDGQRAMALYSASHFRVSDDKARKRLLSTAHRYLKWRNMVWLKNNGYHIYDSGGLTGDENIRKFKLEFGGKIVAEYSGYIANTLKGKILLGIRNLKRAK